MLCRRFTVFIALCLGSLLAHSEAIVGQPATSRWTYLIGLEAWQLSPSIDHDLQSGFDEPNSNLGLANSHTKWRYRSTAPTARVTYSTQLTPSLNSNLKARADQTLGTRVDELSLAWRVSPYLGVRSGVVDYKTSWCRTYDADSGWIRENEFICNTPQFRDATGGAPGLQVFTNIPHEDWLWQAQVGIYNPLLFHYAPTEFGNNIPSPGYQVKRNRKVGVNINALHLETATEFRLSYIHANQQAWSPESHIQGSTQQTSDLIYLGMNFPVAHKVTGRFSYLTTPQKSTCRSSVAALGNCNWNASLQKNSSALEASYMYSDKHIFSLGTNRTNFDNSSTLFNVDHSLYIDVASQLYIHAKQSSVAWRTNWERGFFSVIQYTHASQSNGASNAALSQSKGNALGLKLAYQY